MADLLSLEFADVKPSILNAIIITGIVLITIPAGKFVFSQYYVPGLSELFAAM